MTKKELSRQVTNYLISEGADPMEALSYGDGFPTNFSPDVMSRMKNVAEWDDNSKQRLWDSYQGCARVAHFY